MEEICFIKVEIVELLYEGCCWVIVYLFVIFNSIDMLYFELFLYVKCDAFVEFYLYKKFRG